VLDLGSGAGLDVLVSARRVGPTGRAIGLDVTEEMLMLARRHAAEQGVANADFHLGRIEDIPLPDDSVDVVISNCVIALSTDKPRVGGGCHLNRDTAAAVSRGGFPHRPARPLRLRAAAVCPCTRPHPRAGPPGRWWPVTRSATRPMTLVPRQVACAVKCADQQ